MPGGPDGQTRLFPIIGDPVVYLRSPGRLTRGFAARQVNAVCIPMQVADGDLDAAMAGLARTGNVDGLLVTMPHKAAAVAHCATLSDRARLLGVVSVMRRAADRSWHGEMLDGLAFLKAQVGGGARPAGAKVLLVGAGGAGSAIALALAGAGAREIVIHDPDQGRAGALARLLRDNGAVAARVGPPDPTGCDMVCNASPLGMAEGDALPVAAHLLAAPMFAGDVIAGHGLTPFLRAARAAGCRTAGGDEMVEAALEMMLEFLLGR